ncbi:MAG TPA: DUF4142 domain-containing protein [Vitreimonas sp.]|uniref:DUF4142 domain-containing protein n=1 Tax=Vitreimonas sp. TaxID=3069702 RepID=UPI002D6DA6AC|nr:DUF4142 domain-containing protein [Vitreimonas sp.]HYD87681.1 DUF4142 domain-containing protein [Vitreimonas sp.]
MTRQAFLALGVLALAACGQQTTSETTETAPAESSAPTAAMNDATFAQAVANSDAFEIQSSELAAQRAARQEVKDFAAMMIRDHSQTTQELAALAPQINLTPPAPQLDGLKQDRINALRSASGEAFDDAYLDAQVAAHEEAVRTFEDYIASAQAGPLRDWANTTLPKLRTHLQQVEALENAT